MKLYNQFATGQRHSVLQKREFTSVFLFNPPFSLWGDFGFFTAQLKVLAVCLKQQTHSFTVLAAFAQATLTKCRQKPELTPVNVPH